MVLTQQGIKLVRKRPGSAGGRSCREGYSLRLGGVSSPGGLSPRGLFGGDGGCVWVDSLVAHTRVGCPQWPVPNPPPSSLPAGPQPQPLTCQRPFVPATPSPETSTRLLPPRSQPGIEPPLFSCQLDFVPQNLQMFRRVSPAARGCLPGSYTCQTLHQHWSPSPKTPCG